MVFLMRGAINKRLNYALMASSGGIMLASAIFSLLLPALESNNGTIYASIGFGLGILLFAFLDIFILKNKKQFGLAVTIHNFPEGLAIGVAIGGAMLEVPMLSYAAVLSLAIGIAIQNFPEGAVIALPRYYIDGYSKKKAFLAGVLSGAVEPLGSLLALLFVSFISATLPLFLSFAAGAMMYVIFSEIIADFGNDKLVSYIAFTGGFILMMLLDVILG